MLDVVIANARVIGVEEVTVQKKPSFDPGPAEEEPKRAVLSKLQITPFEGDNKDLKMTGQMTIVASLPFGKEFQLVLHDPDQRTTAVDSGRKFNDEE